MTNDEIRIKIAEACGWTHVEKEEGGAIYGYPKINSCRLFAIPNYPEDLNAMYDALAHLTPEELRQWAVELTAIVLENNSGAWWDLDISETAQVLNATAAQQAEAFLKTLKLWEE